VANAVVKCNPRRRWVANTYRFIEHQSARISKN